MPVNVIEAHKQLLTSIVNRNKDKTKTSVIKNKILPKYKQFRKSFDLAKSNPSKEVMIESAVDAVGEYKDFLDAPPFVLRHTQEYFSPQTKLHSTVLEEFWALLFCELLTRTELPIPASTNIIVGPGEALQNITFAPRSLESLLNGPTEDDPWFQIRLKDRDLMMAVQTKLSISANGVEARLPTKGRADNEAKMSERTKAISEIPICLPFVTLECKQYIDKTMLDNAMAAAKHLKESNPFCLDLIIIELNKLTDLNIGGSGIDNLFILRGQQKSHATFAKGAGPADTVDVGRREPLRKDVVRDIYNFVEKHLGADGFFWADFEAFFKTGRALGQR